MFFVSHWNFLWSGITKRGKTFIGLFSGFYVVSVSHLITKLWQGATVQSYITFQKTWSCNGFFVPIWKTCCKYAYSSNRFLDIGFWAVSTTILWVVDCAYSAMWILYTPCWTTLPVTVFSTFGCRCSTTSVCSTCYPRRYKRLGTSEPSLPLYLFVGLARLSFR